MHMQRWGLFSYYKSRTYSLKDTVKIQISKRKKTKDPNVQPRLQATGLALSISPPLTSSLTIVATPSSVNDRPRTTSVGTQQGYWGCSRRPLIILHSYNAFWGVFNTCHIFYFGSFTRLYLHLYVIGNHIHCDTEYQLVRGRLFKKTRVSWLSHF